MMMMRLRSLTGPSRVYPDAGSRVAGLQLGVTPRPPLTGGSDAAQR